MKNKDLFEGTVKEASIEDGEMLRLQLPSEAGHKKRMVSIIDGKSEASSLLEGHLRSSRRFMLGHRCRGDVDTIRKIALSSTVAALLDARLPGDKAVQSLYLLKKLQPSLAVIILDDNVTLATCIRFAPARPDGFFQIPGTRPLFEQTVQEAINGAMPLPVAIRKKIFDHLARHFAPANGERLTQAETEILAGLLDGKRDKEIAHDRQTKEGTVHSITNSLYKKLKAHSRSELVQRFLPLGETFSIVRRLDPATRQYPKQR
jgi:DNA-binding NarL/FixJ family response regulator